MKLDINNYPGSKSGAGVAEWIINHIPYCECFIEGFAGSGTITFKLLENACLSETLMYLNEIYPPVYEQLRKHNKFPRLLLQNVDTVKMYMKKFYADPERSYSSAVFYFDPPYLMDSRKSKRPLYGYEWNEDDHICFLRLVHALDSAKARIIISHYDHELYNSHLPGWKTSTMKTMTRSGVAEEKIYMNYDINDFDLLCSSFVGKDKIERQRVNRKKTALAKKLAALHPHERQAIIDYIKTNFY